MTSGVVNGAGTINEIRMMSKTLDHIADSRPLFQDLINIQVPCYQNGGFPNFYIPTSAGVNLMYDYQTLPVNAKVSNTSVSYGYSIPPWLHRGNWT